MKSDELPFDGYRLGGRILLGKPKQGDLTARHGYGPPVFEQCGYACVYCGLDMAASFEAWLQLSVDHVIPRQMKNHGYPAALVEDITNLVTCCRACNDFGNRFKPAGPPPDSEAAFFDLRDATFHERRAAVLARREQERSFYANLPAIVPNRSRVEGDA